MTDTLPQEPEPEAAKQKHPYIYAGMNSKNEPDGKVHINYLVYSEILKQRFSIYNFNKQLYVYDAQCGVYRANTNVIETYMRETIKKHGVTDKLSAVIRETITHLEAMGDTRAYPFIGTFGTINVKNGLLNIDTGEIRQSEPEDLCDYQIQTEYREFKETPELDAFMAIYGTTECIDVLAKAIWQRAYHDTVKELTVFYGPKDCGKTTLAEFIQATLDGDTTSQTNTSRTLLHELLQRFGYSNLIGRLMNYGDDLPDLFIKNASRLNTLVGSVVQPIEKKGLDGFTTSVTAYQLFSANNLPPLDDDDNVIWAKIHLVPFDKVITGRKPRDTLFTTILKEQLLYRAIKMAIGWRETPYTNPQSAEQVRSVWHEAGTNVDAFMCEAIVFDYSCETSLEAIKKHYAEWSEAKHKKTYYKYLQKKMKNAWKHKENGNVYTYRLLPLQKPKIDKNQSTI